ncbi:MAG: C40 family peptidase [Chitinispirillia bacterium]|nr:C40 family peptidase [Chitinispirillia bacterium]MCL2241756.1 C40 family peptidase [Chitinispirillia bacterium]
MRRYVRVPIAALSLILLTLSTASCTPFVRFTRPEHQAQAQAQAQVRITKKELEKNAHKPSKQPPIRRKGKKGTQTLLEEVVRSYIGTPYKWGGTTPAGFDCSGFVTTVFNEVYGTPLPRSSAKMWKVGRQIPQPSARPGDLVFFKGSNFSDIGHVGIYMGNNRFAHASTNSGVIYTNLNENYYARRLVGFRRVQ